MNQYLIFSECMRYLYISVAFVQNNLTRYQTILKNVSFRFLTDLWTGTDMYIKWNNICTNIYVCIFECPIGVKTASHIFLKFSKVLGAATLTKIRYPNYWYFKWACHWQLEPILKTKYLEKEFTKFCEIFYINNSDQI